MYAWQHQSLRDFVVLYYVFRFKHDVLEIYLPLSQISSLEKPIFFLVKFDPAFEIFLRGMISQFYHQQCLVQLFGGVCECFQ